MPVTYTATDPVQRAVFARLSGDATLAAKAGVYDRPPDEQAFPYVTIGEAIENPDRTFTTTAFEVLHTLHVWSRGDGFAEAMGILDDLVRLLDYPATPLAVTGFATVFSEYEDAQKLLDPDGLTRHIAARFRIRVEK